MTKLDSEQTNQIKMTIAELTLMQQRAQRAYIEAAALTVKFGALLTLPAEVVSDKMGPIAEELIALHMTVSSIEEA